MSRLTDDDKKLGPITYGKTDWRAIRLVLSSGGGNGDDHGKARNSLTAYGFGYIARIWLPTILKPYQVKHIASTWDAATIARMGRNFYYETFSREYGFSLNDGFFQLYLGAQTHDSVTTQDWSTHLPWTQWRFYRHSFYDLKGDMHWQRAEKRKARPHDGWEEQHAAKEQCPAASFLIEDFDGAMVTVKTIIEQREWKFGEGWFKWLSLFRKNMVRRSLSLAFSEEVGPEKGSWKGGMCGHSIEMLPGELHEAAFKRYCENEQRAKGRNYKIKFIGKAP